MAIHDEICRSIDRFKDRAIGLGRQIHAHPELKFEERFAAGLLTGALGEMGVEVERGVAGLETAFRAETGKSRSESWPHRRDPRRVRRAAQRPLLRPQSHLHRRALGFRRPRRATRAIARTRRDPRHAGRGRRRRQDHHAGKGRAQRRRRRDDGASGGRRVRHLPDARHAPSAPHVPRARLACGGGAMGGRERARGGDPDLPERRRRAAAFSRRLAHPRHHHQRRSGGEYHPREGRVRVSVPRPHDQLHARDRRPRAAMRRGGRRGHRNHARAQSPRAATRT